MKFLKIGIIALSLGTFITACNNTHCPPPVADSPATSVNAIRKDSNTISTAAENATAANITAGNQKNGKRLNGKYANTPDSTMIKEKKREGNFTSGTGVDNPGR